MLKSKEYIIKKLTSDKRFWMKTSLSIYTVDGRKIHIEFRVREPSD